MLSKPLGTIAYTLLLSLCPYFVLVAILYPTEGAYFLTNRAPGEIVANLPLLAASSILGTILFYLQQWHHKPQISLATLVATCKEWNQQLWWFFFFPLAAFLRAPKIESDLPWVTCALILAAAGMVAVFVNSGSQNRVRALGDFFVEALSPVQIWTLLILAISTYTLVMSIYAVSNHQMLETSRFDLGVYDNVLWNTSHGFFLQSPALKLGTHLSAHFDPILLSLAPFYKNWPRAETALVAQSVWLASGALPIFLLSSSLLGRTSALVFACSYLLFPALHGINMYDFHSVALVVPIVLWAFYWLQMERIYLFIFTCILILTVREDMGLMLACIGGWLVLFSPTHKLGLFTLILGLGYFITIKVFVMPEAAILTSDPERGYQFERFFQALIPNRSSGVTGLITTIITNPLFVIKETIVPHKLLYFCQMFGPLLFIPFFSGRWVFLLAYGMAFGILGTFSVMTSIHTQYSAFCVPFAFITAIYGVLKAAGALPGRSLVLIFPLQRLKSTLLVSILVSSLLFSWKFGALLPNSSFSVGWRGLYNRSYFVSNIDKLTVLQDFLLWIPPTAKIAADDTLYPHISNRRFAYPLESANMAEYILSSKNNPIDEITEKSEGKSSGSNLAIISSNCGITLLQNLNFKEDISSISPE